MKYFFSVFILFVILFSASCRKDFDTTPGNSDFRIEKDTLLLDSVFTGISSHTYRFKIYNTSDKDITLNKVYLEKGEQSFYRLNVDGTPCKSIDNVLIHAKDSIFVFVEVTADINQLSDPVYEEKLFVKDAGKEEHILLTSFVKDADFYYPERFPDGSKDSLTVYTDPQTGATSKIAGFFLPGNTTFTNVKPIVVYGHMAVPQGKTLTIEQGAHLYFHFNSGLIVWNGASLKINGTLGNEVVFEDDRLDPDYADRPGMWNYIWLREGSVDNEINYAVIKNANVGIVAYPSGNTNPVLHVKNTQFYNHSLAGIFGIATEISGENLVFNNFGVSAVNIQLGGKYDFKHCTFANYGGGIRNEKSAAFYANNFIKTENEIFVNDLEQLNISNSIMYGNSSIEFYLDKNDNAIFNYLIKNCLIKFNDPQDNFSDVNEVDFSDIAHYQQILLNEEPEFWDTQENKMQIDENSPAINQGDISTAQQVPLDIMERDRTAMPDLGSYQNAPKPD